MLSSWSKEEWDAANLPSSAVLLGSVDVNVVEAEKNNYANMTFGKIVRFDTFEKTKLNRKK